MSTDLFDGAYPDPEPESPPEGLGKDALRTWRRRQMLARGVHPATEVSLKGSDTCSTCRFLWAKDKRTFHGWKCELAATGDRDGPDMVKSWPACMWWEGARDA